MSDISNEDLRRLRAAKGCLFQTTMVVVGYWLVAGIVWLITGYSLTLVWNGVLCFVAWGVFLWWPLAALPLVRWVKNRKPEPWDDAISATLEQADYLAENFAEQDGLKRLGKSIDDMIGLWESTKTAAIPPDWSEWDRDEQAEFIKSLWASFSAKLEWGDIHKMLRSVVHVGLQGRYETVEVDGEREKHLIIVAEELDGLRGVMNEFFGEERAVREWVFREPSPHLYDQIVARAELARARHWVIDEQTRLLGQAIGSMMADR